MTGNGYHTSALSDAQDSQARANTVPGCKANKPGKGKKMTTRANLRTLGLVVWVCTAATTWARDIYVDTDAPGANNGTSWLNAYHYLQDALAVARPGNIIKVAQGIYRPNQATGPVTSGRSATFVMQTGVALLGGFAGYGTGPWPSNDRDPLLYPSTLSGDLNGDDWSVDPNDHAAIGLLLTAPTRQDNCYSVVTASFTDPTAVLDGFTIMGGIANGTTATRGGGIVSYQGSPTIRNCTIKACAATDSGGGMYTSLGEPNLAQCTLAANYAAKYGAGMYNLSADPNLVQCAFEHNLVGSQGKGGGMANDASNPIVVSCTFKKNFGGMAGGGIYSLQSDPNMVSCTFIENTTTLSGGALENSTGCRPRISNCRFSGNNATNQGGAISNWGSTPRLVDCTFVGNRCLTGDGGAVYNHSADPNLVNCLFNGNKSDSFGGAISCYESNVQVVNCTFSANTALSGQAVACSSPSPPDTRSRLVIANSILWDSGAEIYNNDGSEIGVTYTDIYGYWPGAGNKAANPLFVDRDGPDNVLGNEDDKLTLSGLSACIDAGNNSAVPIDIRRDLAGKTRFINDPNTADVGKGQPPLVDMGAYEFGTDAQGQNPPVANAGQDQTVHAQAGGYASVAMDGSGSYDPDGSPLQYTWTWTIGAQTYQATGVKPTIQLPVGQHTIGLVVFDGTLYSNPDYLQVSVIQSGGLPPVANAGPDQTAYTPSGGYASVTLDGSGSYDPDGSLLQYTWTWTIGTQTYHATDVKPTIQLPVGQHTIYLMVFDGTYYSNPDSVRITVIQTGGLPPVANAGPDKTAYTTSGGYASVALDGSGSYDPDGSPLQYTWTWTIGAQTYQATGVKPTIQLPVGQHTIGLVVFDGNLYSNPDYIQVTILQTGGLPPVAKAGPDKTAYTTSGGYASVALDGSGSYDPDGSPLQYSWTWTIGAQTYQATGVKPTIQLPVGQHTIGLVVFDGTLYSNPDYLQVTILQTGGLSPVANAGPDKTAYAPSGGYASVALDGSGSYDPEGSPLQYSWTWTIGAQTFYATGVRPTIQLPVGQHTVSLTVFDGTYYSNPDSMRVTVLQSGGLPPVANAGPDQTAYAAVGGYASVALDGSGSYDPDGSPLQYSWTWTIGAQTYHATGVGPAIQLPAGQRTIDLIVFDGTLYSAADHVIVTVAEIQEYPLYLWPYSVNREDSSTYLMVLIVLPDIGADQIDLATPLTLNPGEVQAFTQHATQRNDGSVTTTVFAMFREEDLLNAMPQDGFVNVTVVGWFVFGQPFSGTGAVRLTH